MNGYPLTFYTEQNRRHEWLLAQASSAGIHGATVVATAESVGHTGVHHAARFFELADQPVQIIFAVTEAESERIFDTIRHAGVRLFYTRCAVESGTLGALPAAG